MNEKKCPENGELMGRKDLSNNLQRVVIWIRIFGKMRNGTNIQKWAKWNLWNTAFEKSEGMWSV